MFYFVTVHFKEIHLFRIVKKVKLISKTFKFTDYNLIELTLTQYCYNDSLVTNVFD